MARKPDAGTGRPVRRRARLNEGKWVPTIHAVVQAGEGGEVGQFVEVVEGVRGEFGHGLNRVYGERSTTVYFDQDGNRYEDPDSPVTLGQIGAKGTDLSNHPLFVGTGDDIADYSEGVLARFNLPRPGAPGMFWEDAASGLLRWGPEAPPDLLDRIPFVGLYEPMAGKFVEENIDQWRDCWEAPLASAYLDRWGQINDELDRVYARFGDAAHDMNVSSLFAGERRSHRDPRAFPSWAFDKGYSFGRLIGELTEAWRLGLLHGPLLLHDQRRRAGASSAAKTGSSQRRTVSNAWKRELFRLADAVSGDRPLGATPLSIPALAAAVMQRATKESKKTGAFHPDRPAEEAGRSAVAWLANLQQATVERALRKRQAKGPTSSREETLDDHSS